MPNYKFSYFKAPIAPQKDAEGRIIKSATLRPVATASVAQVFEFITTNERLREVTEQVRSAADMRAAKAALLPYITPCGIFTERKSSGLVELSGLLPIDIDHLDSYEEAARMRDRLFEDPALCPALCFVSPGGRGVKALVPYRTDGIADPLLCLSTHIYWTMFYVQTMYETDDVIPGKGVDPSGKDPVRACFLSHDADARMREIKL